MPRNATRLLIIKKSDELLRSGVRGKEGGRRVQLISATVFPKSVISWSFSDKVSRASQTCFATRQH